MVQIVSGTNSDLTKTVSQLVMELLQSQWPTSNFDPLAADIIFGVDTWNDYGDIAIHVNPYKTTSVPMTIGWTRSKVDEVVAIHLYMRKNQPTMPVQMGNAQRKIEEIIKDNAANLGQGIMSLRFDAWGNIMIDNPAPSIWHIIARATATYVKVTI